MKKDALFLGCLKAEVAEAKWTPERVIALLNTSDEAVERAIVVIYERQTPDEQNHECVKYLNGRGFSAHDVEFGTSLAKGCLKYGHLTAKQMPYARKMTIKYAGQLADEANERLLKEMETTLA